MNLSYSNANHASNLFTLSLIDYEMGAAIKEEIIPNAVDWYTGEFEDFDDEEDEEGEDDEDDDEEEEEEEDDVPKPQKNKNQRVKKTEKADDSNSEV